MRAGGYRLRKSSAALHHTLRATDPPPPLPAANYTAVSDRGSVVVEINGVNAAQSGVLGVAKSSKGTNYVSLYSEGGDVQLSQLASLV